MGKVSTGRGREEEESAFHAQLCVKTTQGDHGASVAPAGREPVKNCKLSTATLKTEAPHPGRCFSENRTDIGSITLAPKLRFPKQKPR